MTEQEIIGLARIRLDDRIGPSYLWSDEVIIDALRSGMQEAAERGRMIPDTLILDLNPGSASYSFPVPVLDVLRVRHPGASAPLRQTTRQGLDGRRSMWEAEAGQPREYILTDQNGLILVPTPDAAAQLTVEVYRSVLAADPLGVIPAQYHRDLVWWICFQCFSCRDADDEDSPRAQQALALFERRFGPRKSAVWDRIHRSLPAGTCALAGRIA